MVSVASVPSSIDEPARLVPRLRLAWLNMLWVSGADANRFHVNRSGYPGISRFPISRSSLVSLACRILEATVHRAASNSRRREEGRALEILSDEDWPKVCELERRGPRRPRRSGTGVGISGSRAPVFTGSKETGSSVEVRSDMLM